MYTSVYCSLLYLSVLKPHMADKRSAYYINIQRYSDWVISIKKYLHIGEYMYIFLTQGPFFQVVPKF